MCSGFSNVRTHVWLARKKNLWQVKALLKKSVQTRIFCCQFLHAKKIRVQTVHTVHLNHVYSGLFLFFAPPSLMQKILEKTAGRINGVDLSPTNNTLSPPHKYSNVRLEEFLLYTFARLPY